MPDEIVPVGGNEGSVKSWDNPTMGAAFDALTAGIPDLPPGSHETDMIERPAESGAPLDTAPTRADAAAPDAPTGAEDEALATDTAANVAILTRIAALGGLAEVEIMNEIARPFMEGTSPDSLAALAAIEKARGPAFTGEFARGVVESYWPSVVRDVVGREGERIINALLLTQEEFLALDQRGREEAEAIRSKDPDLTLKVANFRKGNGLTLRAPGPISAPSSTIPSVLTGSPAGKPNGVAHPATTRLPKIDPDDYDSTVEKYVEDAEALSAYASTLETQLAEIQERVRSLESSQKSVTETAEDLQKKADYNAASRIFVEVDGVVLNYVRGLKFSTNLDPAVAEQEDDETRRDIQKLAGAKFLEAINRDRNKQEVAAPGTPGELFDRAKAAIARDDYMGRQVRQDVQELKKLMDGITKELLPKFNGRAVAAKAEAAVTPTPTRTTVSGAGTGSAPQLPEPSATLTPAKAWETGSMEREYNQRMAQRGQRPA